MKGVDYILDIYKDKRTVFRLSDIVMMFPWAENKFYGIISVLDYGAGERKLKVEISNRSFGDRYEVKNLLGVNMQVMVAPDMFAHKLCAMLDRTTITNRDIFDCWF